MAIPEFRAPSARDFLPKIPRPFHQAEYDDPFFTDDERQSFIGSLGRKSVSGLGAVGHLLDLPGSSTRDMLAGKNPFDQWLDPFGKEAHDNRTTGRQLLRGYGLAGKQDTWGNFGAGLGAEIALDPLTYLTLGGSALSKAGQAAKGASLIDDAAKVASKQAGKRVGPRVARMTTRPQDLIDDAVENLVNKGTPQPEALEQVMGSWKNAGGTDQMLGDNLGSLMGFGMPFGEASFTSGTGPLAQKIAGGLDTAGHAVRYGAYSPIRPLAGLLDHSTMGAVTEHGQQVGQTHSKFVDDSIVKARKSITEPFRAFEESTLFNGDVIAKAKALPRELAQKEAIDNSRQMRKYLERPFQREGMTPEELADYNSKWELPDTPEWNSIRPHAEKLRESMSEILRREQEVGLKTTSLQDFAISYFPRQKHHFPKGTPGAKGYSQIFDTTHPHQIQRREELTNVGLGSYAIDEMSLDPKISGYIHRERPDEVIDKILQNEGKVQIGDAGLESVTGQSIDEMRKEFKRFRDKKLRPEDVEHLRDQIFDRHINNLILEPEEMAKLHNLAYSPMIHQSSKQMIEGNEFDKLLRSMAFADPQHADKGVPLFNTDPMLDAVSRLEHGERSIGAANATYDLLSSQAKRFMDTTSKDPVSVADFLATTKMDPNRAREVMFERLGDQGKAALKELEDANLAKFQSDIAHAVDTGSMSKSPVPASLDGEQVMIKGLGDGDGMATILKGGQTLDVPFEALSPARTVTIDDALREFYIDPEIAKDASRYMRGFTAPESLNPFLGAMDKFLNAFKTSVTAIFPAFHMRNFVSGQYQNFIGNAYDPKYRMNPLRAYYQPVKDAFDVMRGKEISNVLEIPIIKSRGITDAKEATKFIQDLAFQQHILGRRQGVSNEVLGDSLHNLAGEFPGLRSPFQPVPDASLADRMKPWNMKGVAAEDDVFGLARWGRGIGDGTETLNRFAPFIAYIKQGLDPAEAARRVKALQVDYSNLSSFERGTMRRIAPFYSFFRGSLPTTVEHLIQRPGGKMGRTAMTSASAHDDSGLTPDYISETASIPMGTLEDGSKRYMTGFGLMMEDPLSFGGLLAGDVRGAGLEALSRMNPLIKGPLEYATGQSFFQKGPMGGRPLEDLDPTMGRIASNVGELLGGEKVAKPPHVGGQLGEVFMANMPTSRLMTTARQATDPRKHEKPQDLFANLLTGVRMSHVSPGAQDAILREAADEEMRRIGAKSFRRTYFSKDQKAEMPDKEREAALRLELIMDELAERTKQRVAERKKRELASR